VLELAGRAVEAARRAGADYADARVVREDSESITVRNQEMEGIDRASSEGVGIRVLVDGRCFTDPADWPGVTHRVVGRAEHG